MAFSGTVSQTTFDKRKVVERAYARCRVAPQLIVGEMVQDASEELYLMLSDWANQQIPLWTIEEVILPMYEGRSEVPTGVGTNDVLSANLRTLTTVSGSNTDTSSARSTVFSSATYVTTVGIKWSATPPASVTLERSDDGSSWTEVLTQDIEEVSGDWTWLDTPSAVASLYFRVVGSGAMTYSSLVYGNTPTEVPLGRWNRDDWFQTPNKLNSSSRPLSYWFDRKVPEPTLHLWPTPDADAETSQIVVQRQRYIMDVGTMTQEIEVPQRWLDAVTYGLAARLALTTDSVPLDLLPLLEAKAAEALNRAQTEEYDSGTMKLVPDFSCYTA